ncbi:hypothetical protein [Sporolactobacillus terrae]|uniref:hypothetical protein n=1 Tax=Sporolactobacillus terrae TaxID=269673 RepID=UPI001260C5A3|nr:hypothetical protein [Sporolactobacillus terrae]
MYAYILLTHAKTLPSALIKLWTGDAYTHAALALDTPQHMYSFGRKGKYNFLNGGFTENELKDQPADLRLMILRLTISPAQHQQLACLIRSFRNRRNQLHYNFSGILGLMLQKEIHSQDRFFCSQFVAAVLAECGICAFPKPCCFIKPADFAQIDEANVLFEGLISDYFAMSQDLLDGDVTLQMMQPRTVSPLY